MYWMTSSRRWCSKSMSMSGGSLRSALMKRSKSSEARFGVDLGDAQAVAHERVGRAAAALAQDALVARPAHDVGHGEEVRLVLELRMSASSCSTCWRSSGAMPVGKARRCRPR
jgi:hypothetical protein